MVIFISAYKMKEVKVHIWHVMLWEFKNNNNTTETVKKVCSVYGQHVITDCKVPNWFPSSDTSLTDEPKPEHSDIDQAALRELVECIAFREIVNFSNTIFFRQHKWMTKLFFNNTTKKVFYLQHWIWFALVLQDSWSLGLLVLEMKWRSEMLRWPRVLLDVWGIVFRVTV